MINMGRKNLNWSVPELVWNEFDRAMSPHVQGRQKWIAAVAAIVMFLEADEEDRAKYIDRASATAVPSGEKRLLEEIAAGKESDLRIAAKRPKDVKVKRSRGPRS